MTQTRRAIRSLPVLAFCCVVIAGVAVGCAEQQRSSDAQVQTDDRGTPSASTAQHAETDVAFAGAQLWAQNCIRCHNYRAPSSLSDRQWEIVMHHMRVRASLTAQEHEQILQFLKAGN